MYIRFTKMHNIPDPCSSQSGYKRIIACFIEQLMFDHNSHSATVRGYVEAILCFGFAILTSLLTCWIVPTCVHKSSLPKREKRILQGNKVLSRVRCSLLFWNWQRKNPLICLKQLLRIGSHSSESLDCIALSMHKRLNLKLIHTNANTLLGKCVLKAFTLNDWKFYNSKGHVINIHTSKSKPV